MEELYKRDVFLMMGVSEAIKRLRVKVVMWESTVASFVVDFV